MSGHHGDCQKLLNLLNDAFPDDVFSKFVEHKKDSVDCLMNILGILVNKAIKHKEQITSYALICSMIAEAFDSDPTYNPFKVALARQLKTELDNTRLIDLMKCSKEEDIKKMDQEIAKEKDKSRRQILVSEQKAGRRKRDSIISLMQLFGELFNAELLTYGVLRLCIIELLVPIANAEEIDVECFCVLMKTAGAKMESKPEGIEIADKYMSGLEALINRGKAVKFCEKIKKMISQLFYLRAEQWKDAEVGASALPEILQNNKLIEEAYANNEFLKDLRTAVSNIKTQSDWLEFMMPFRELKVWNEERLKGSVQVIAKHALSNPDHASILALVCKGLEDVSAMTTESKESKSFLNFLKDFCDQEKTMIFSNASKFASFKARIQALKKCTEDTKFLQQKEELTKELKTQEQANNFVSFYGELFNAEIIGSAEVLDYFVALMERDIVNEVFVECFCILFAVVATKILSEKNHKALLKDSIVKLSKCVKTGDFSMKTRQLVDDLEKSAHFRFKLHTWLEAPPVQLDNPVRLAATLSHENLWTSSAKPTTSELGQETTQAEFFKKYLHCSQTQGPPPGLQGAGSFNRGSSGVLHHA